jgi:hypothetical protein
MAVNFADDPASLGDRMRAAIPGKHLRRSNGGTGPIQTRSTGLRVILWLTLATSALLTLSGNALLALWPPVIVGMAWALLALPFEMATALSVFVFLSLNPRGLQPHGGLKWWWPLDPIGAVFYKNLAKASLADVTLIILLIRSIITIRLSDVGTGGLERRPMRPYAQACLYSSGAIFAFTAWGYVGGGSLHDAYWQVIKLLWFPLICLIASVAATRPQGIHRMRSAIVIAATVKAVEAILFKFTYVVPVDGKFPDFVTTHSDSVLWATATCILVAEWFEERQQKQRRLLLGLGTLYVLAMVFNNRRTVWVGVLAGVFFILSVAQRPVKKQVAQLFAVTWPILVLYVGIGLARPSQSVVFKPVNMIRSVVLQEDTSSDTRDIENFNLLVTLSARPLVGFGFGHPYIEQIVAYDVTKSGFVNYRFIPHNSYLGLWAFGGVAFPALYFLPVVVGVFYAVRSRRESRNAKRRAAASWAVCAVIAYLVQGWSDIGLQDWVAILCAGVGLGIGGALPRLVANEDAEEAALAAASQHRGPSSVEIARKRLEQGPQPE